ncbi:hypothetical protein L596_002854 [Steinernema carpocapsae]|uniref:Matrix-remodeling-associated protein 7 helical domain-containing protein n=1 Tax=Steinernema carpocapsae TaxID=34508 RepID=A0A4U8UQP8_STECR|nr:hypothetical protein L596_002854 [Steinernema carpocapsae]
MFVLVVGICQCFPFQSRAREDDVSVTSGVPSGMTFVSFAVDLITRLRGFTDGFVCIFTVLVGFAAIILVSRILFRRNQASDSSVDHSDGETTDIEDDEVSQDDVIKRVIESKDSEDEDTSCLISDFECDRESTIDILQTLGKLHGKLASAELRVQTKKLEKSLTEQQRQEESEIKNKQLESIYSLMMSQGDKFGLHNKEEIEEQLKLYAA